MKILGKLRSNKKMVIVLICLFFINIIVGGQIGISRYKERLGRVSFGMWGTGVTFMRQGEYDYALYYFSQAIALHKDEPLFYHALAETLEAKRNPKMAMDFYKIALQKYKEQNIKEAVTLIEKKISILQETERK